MSIWSDFGFRESPYATDPIPPTEEGDRLLVGREREIKRLTNHLTSSGLHPTIEGDNGVGKTSLVSVTGYRLSTKLGSGETNQALLPLRRTFQLTPGDTGDTLARKVFFEVARAFIDHRDILKKRGFRVPNVDDVNRWLNAPVFSARGGGVSVLGSGVSASASSAPNTAAGFSEAGFSAMMDKWLGDCFSSKQAGGFICVIDNLELLETSQNARSLLESIRDTVLDQRGLRWVLCGARGIVRTAASSQRLEGRLAEPMELDPISDRDVDQVVARRIEVYRSHAGAVAPVGPEGFRHLYDVLNRNLRNALKFCEDFAFWLIEEGTKSDDPDENLQLLEVWLTDQADRYNQQTRLGNRAWTVFDTLATMKGSCSPSDYDAFEFNSSMAMRPHVKALEDANLVQSTFDDYDKRRKTIVMTPRGWLVRYARAGYAPPS